MEWLDGGGLDDELVPVTSLGLDFDGRRASTDRRAMDAGIAAQIIPSRPETAVVDGDERCAGGCA
jgi:hypothetical protein